MSMTTLSSPAQMLADKTQEYARMFGLGAGSQTRPFAGLAGGNGPLAQLFKGLAQAFEGLAELVGGKPAATSDAAQPAPASSKPIAGTARIWGDPHFIGADGGTFDVQGQAGKTYNLLSDRGFQMNGRFDKYGDGGATVVGEVGITAGTNYVNVDKTGKAIVNGQVLKDGERVALRGGGYVEKKGSNVTVKSGEWQVDFQTHRSHINMDIKTDNAVADGVRPHGLIGQTFDGDGKARNGDKGANTQGGGAIEDANGRITRAGDRDAVRSYEVAALWDTNFQTHNRDHGQGSVILDSMGGADLTSSAAYRTALTGQIGLISMMGFAALMASLSGGSNWGGSSTQW